MTVNLKCNLPETYQNWIGYVNNCIYYAHQTGEIYQELYCSVDFKAHEELLWHPWPKVYSMLFRKSVKPTWEAKFWAFHLLRMVSDWLSVFIFLKYHRYRPNALCRKQWATCQIADAYRHPESPKDENVKFRQFNKTVIRPAYFLKFDRCAAACDISCLIFP